MRSENGIPQPLLARLATLERRHGRTRWALLVMTLVAYGALVAAGTTLWDRPLPTRIEAREVVLRDAAGVVRATLAVGTEGAPALDLYDASGHDRLRLAIGVDGFPAVHLYASEGRSRAVLFDSEDLAALSFQSEDGRPRALLSRAALSFFDKDGQPLAAGRSWMTTAAAH